MDTGKLFSALNSDLRRRILVVLAEKPNTVLGVMQTLKNKGFSVKYRETVYRSLETLLDAGLVEKFYDREEGLCYRSSSAKLTIEIKNGVIVVS